MRAGPLQGCGHGTFCRLFCNEESPIAGTVFRGTQIGGTVVAALQGFFCRFSKNLCLRACFGVFLRHLFRLGNVSLHLPQVHPDRARPKGNVSFDTHYAAMASGAREEAMTRKMPLSR